MWENIWGGVGKPENTEPSETYSSDLSCQLFKLTQELNSILQEWTFWLRSPYLSVILLYLSICTHTISYLVQSATQSRVNLEWAHIATVEDPKPPLLPLFNPSSTIPILSTLQPPLPCSLGLPPLTSLQIDSPPSGSSNQFSSSKFFRSGVVVRVGGARGA